ncbi:hypothetical protein [Pseudonocardia hydrocarbonoxydans]|uniref:Uncharacterized protein n=1 Tax=Pseudonocardia hydrocarbonoxydans TaxID=76726 RepID=A0A4Y3WK99_9PSEU|nr:hypothetical protein [Pseudonocardia hydrocarbonoxydans]GEC17766.1 hypothetical protein PHY01_00490 [Pseudonocardia hydrocarbonoxydans]
MHPTAGPDHGGAAAAQARWRAAEDRLYPVAMSDPDGYRRGLEAVRDLVAHLRGTAHTLDDLVAVEADPAALLAALPAGGPALPADLLVAAACGARAREVLAEDEARRRAAVVADARSQGRAWAVLQGPERIEELYGGSTVATHLDTGRTLLAAVDPYAGGEPYLLQEFDPEGRPGPEHRFADAAAWVAERDRRREEIESS